MMKLSLIVAKARNGVIGRDNTLPWRLPDDLAHFRRTTMGHPIVMGRKTWESIGRPLPGRRSIVVTRNADWQADGAERAGSLDAALALCGDAAEVFVIGGAQLFETALPLADAIVATEIAADVDGDASFPALDPREWSEIARREHAPPTPDGWAYAFVEYARLNRP
jgi:dihydrofolate reductase